MENNRIERIKYKFSYFDFSVGGPARTDYRLAEDGSVEYRSYRDGSRKCIEKGVSKKATAEDYQRLCADLEACIAAADRVEWQCDDCDAEIILYRSFCRVDSMLRGYGTESINVGEIIHRYLTDVAGL